MPIYLSVSLYFVQNGTHKTNFLQEISGKLHLQFIYYFLFICSFTSMFVHITSNSRSTTKQQILMLKPGKYLMLNLILTSIGENNFVEFHKMFLFFKSGFGKLVRKSKTKKAIIIIPRTQKCFLILHYTFHPLSCLHFKAKKLWFLMASHSSSKCF